MELLRTQVRKEITPEFSYDEWMKSKSDKTADESKEGKMAKKKS